MSANAAELELQAVYPDRKQIVRDGFLTIASRRAFMHLT